MQRYGDFQCELTEGFPTNVIVDFESMFFEIELNENLVSNGMDINIEHYHMICTQFGRRYFTDAENLIELIRCCFGEEAYKNCVYTIAREFDIELD